MSWAQAASVRRRSSMQESVAIRSSDDVARIRAACAIVREVLDEVARAAVPGVSTAELDRLALSRTRALGADPAFLGYHGYPASLCVSVNDEVVHGIPSPSRVLAEGDVVGLDFGAVLDGWYGDAAVTVPVGRVAPAAERLLEAGREALARAVAAIRPGATTGDLGAAVQRYVEAQGYSVVRDFVGHGIGRRLHEPPHLPNFGTAGAGERIVPGMVLAVEPMVNAGDPEVDQLDDGWTAVTSDGSLSVHFEHTLVVTENGPEILTLPRDGRGPGAGEA